MIIVLEGPDNSGKSTLAKYLSEVLLIPVRHSGGPGKHPGEIQERIDQYHNDGQELIYDRHPVISQGIYLSALRVAGEYPTIDREKRFYDSKPLIIYCRNRGTLEGHVVSEHTTGEYVRRVEMYFGDLCETYDRWALRRANYFYRIGDDMDDVVRFVQSHINHNTVALTEALRAMRRFDPLADVEAFHKKFGQEYQGPPRVLPDDLATFREEFLKEEVDEYIHHANAARRELLPGFFDGKVNGERVTEHLVGMLDSLVDEVYVALGTSHFHGFDFREAWNRVHRANMGKIRATSQVRGKRGESKYDIIKPQGWKAPVHDDLVRGHEHDEVRAAGE